MIKVDLHTHSIASPDGGINAQEYHQILDAGLLDCVAITDHNRIDFAQNLQADLGPEKIIIGEEISTTEGDIIGLFLTKQIDAGLELKAAIQEIKNQGGIVYIPHPFETVRQGISEEALELIKDDIDIIETANGRALFQNFGPQAVTWVRLQRSVGFGSSDAHRAGALGKTYSTIAEYPTAGTIVELAQKARIHYSLPSLPDILAPKLNRFKKFLNKKS